MKFLMKSLSLVFALIMSLSMIQAGEVEELLDSSMSQEQMLQRFNEFSKQGGLVDNLCYKTFPVTVLNNRSRFSDTTIAGFLTGEFLCAYNDTTNILHMVTQSNIEKKVWFVKNPQGILEIYTEKKHGKLYWLNESLSKLLSSGGCDVRSAQKVNADVTKYLTTYKTRDQVFEKEPMQDYLDYIDQITQADLLANRPTENLWQVSAPDKEKDRPADNFSAPDKAKKSPTENPLTPDKVFIKKHKNSFIVGGIFILMSGIAYKLWKHWREPKSDEDNIENQVQD